MSSVKLQDEGGHFGRRQMVVDDRLKLRWDISSSLPLSFSSPAAGAAYAISFPAAKTFSPPRSLQ